MLIALSIMGLALGLFLPNLSPSIDRARLYSSARDIASALKTCQENATATGREYSLILDLDHYTYSIEGKKKQWSMSKNLNIRIYTASHEIFGDRIAKIRFYPDGTATGGRISLSLNSKTLDIDINWITGGVEVRVPGKE